MKIVRYKLHLSDSSNDDPERAVLPALIYAKRVDGDVSSQVLALGWWAWGFGIIRTVYNVTEITE